MPVHWGDGCACASSALGCADAGGLCSAVLSTFLSGNTDKGLAALRSQAQPQPHLVRMSTPTGALLQHSCVASHTAGGIAVSATGNSTTVVSGMDSRSHRSTSLLLSCSLFWAHLDACVFACGTWCWVATLFDRHY